MMVDALPYRMVIDRLVQDGANDRRIAERIGFSATAVRNIRLGRTKLLHPQTAQAIADFLRVVA